MRRASVLAQLGLRAANAASAQQQAAAPAVLAALEAATTSQPAWGARSFAAGPAAGHSSVPKGEPTLLQKVMPQVVAGIGKGIGMASGGAKAAVSGLLTSGAAKGAVSAFADKVLVAETFLGLGDVDLPLWASWLAAGGYTNKAGWLKIAAAAHAQLARYDASEVAALVAALHSAGVYDKKMYDDFAAVVRAKFTEFETPGLAKIAVAFAARGHYDIDTFDDIADGIAYCNHFFAPMEVPLPDLAGVFAAYAKYHHDRADMFVMLARAINEDKILALPDEQLAPTVMSFLKAFDTFGFWPDATEGLFVVADVRRPGAFSPQDKADIAAYVAKVESLAGGNLTWYRGGYADPEHFHGAPFSNYNLWVARDELSGQTYRPSEMRPWKQ